MDQLWLVVSHTCDCKWNFPDEKVSEASSNLFRLNILPPAAAADDAAPPAPLSFGRRSRSRNRPARLHKMGRAGREYRDDTNCGSKL